MSRFLDNVIQQPSLGIVIITTWCYDIKSARLSESQTQYTVNRNDIRVENYSETKLSKTGFVPGYKLLLLGVAAFR